MGPDKIDKNNDNASDQSGKSEEEIIAEIQEAMSKTPVKDFVTQFLMTLSSIAFQRMGIYQDPKTANIDLDQAKLAIDCYSSLSGILTGFLSDEEKKTIEGVLSSLRMAYIERNK